MVLDSLYYGVFIAHTKFFLNLFTWDKKDKWGSVSSRFYPEEIKRNRVLLNLASTQGREMTQK